MSELDDALISFCGLGVPDGWVDDRQLCGALATRYDLDVLVVSSIAMRLAREAPGRYITRSEQRWNNRGEGIGPLMHTQEGSAEMLINVIGKLRRAIDDELGIALIDLDGA